MGDFDFHDPSNPSAKDEYPKGKPYKFAMGLKPAQKVYNMDVPGPGHYDVDIHSFNQMNVAHLIGTDVRRDFAVHNARDYPGPGSYEHIAP